MNQFVPISAFKSYEPLSDIVLSEKISISTRLRHLAAEFQMHHAFIHRLGSPKMLLRDATYVATIRNLESSAWTLESLINSEALENLIAGNRPVLWCRSRSEAPLKIDPVNRLDLRFGVSVPFHNALGNHVALTLCDSTMPEIDLCELSRYAQPLIETALGLERAANSTKIKLTSRECDCLQWAAAGKTSIETGIILSLSPFTVNQYLSAATVKLKAVNRTHAVTKAARMGLINLSGV